MIDVRYELEQLHDNPEWLTVLETYDRLITSSKKADPESAGWITRLREFDGVEQEDLSHIHGSLIAHGFLRFQIADRTAGMEYQLSQLGKKALTHEFTDENDEGVATTSDQRNVRVSHDGQALEVAGNAVSEQQTVFSDQPSAADIDADESTSETAEATVGSDAPDQNLLDEANAQLVAEVESAEVETVVGESSATDMEPFNEQLELVQLVTETTTTVDAMQTVSEGAESNKPNVVEFSLPIIDLDELKKSA